MEPHRNSRSGTYEQQGIPLRVSPALCDGLLEVADDLKHRAAEFTEGNSEGDNATPLELRREVAVLTLWEAKCTEQPSPAADAIRVEMA